MKRSSFSHEIDDFRNAIDAARQRIAELKNPIIEESALFEELTTTMEELQVADEELHAQDEALDAAYASLAASHKHYQDLFEAAPWVYLLTDTNGVIREANKEAGHLFNMDRQYLIGKPLTLYLDKADKSFFRQQIQVLLKSSDVHRWEMTVLPRHDAPPIPVAVICVKAVEDFSIHNHLRWLLYDLTLQKKAEETEREKIFRSSFDQVGVGVAYLSPEGKWLRVNKKLTNMLGYTADELLETDYRDLTDIEDIHASIDAHLKLMSRQAETVSVEKRFHRKDGSVLWASVTSSLITDSSQRPIYIISVIEDITIRKQIELAANAKHETAELLQTTGTQLTSTLRIDCEESKTGCSIRRCQSIPRRRSDRFSCSTARLC